LLPSKLRSRGAETLGEQPKLVTPTRLIMLEVLLPAVIHYQRHRSAASRHHTESELQDIRLRRSIAELLPRPTPSK
jgi:hypothetical protein